MKVRKKPMIIEGVQWFKHGDHPAVQNTSSNPEYGVIYTLEGHLNVIPGDWIMTGVKGEHWPVKADIFDITYDIIGE